MIWCHALLLATILCARASHGLRFGSSLPRETRLWASQLAPKSSSRPYRKTRSSNKDPSALVAWAPIASQGDLSALEVGRELSGQVTKVASDGVTVSIGSDVSVFLPTSQLSASQLSKAKQLLAAKSLDAVHVILTSVDSEKGILTGKWASSAWKPNPIKEMSTTDYAGKIFKGEIVSVHSYGVFIKIKELNGVSGMIPASHAGLPRGSTPEKAFSVGSLVDVQVVDINVIKNQVTFKRAIRPQAKVTLSKDISSLPRDRWIDAIITGVNKYAAFLKVANRDVSAFLHQSQVPSELVSFLRGQLAAKGRTLKASSSSPTAPPRFDMDTLFQEGDIIQVRVTSSDLDEHALQVTMLPIPSSSSSSSSGEQVEEPVSSASFDRGEYQLSDKQMAHMNALLEYFSSRHAKRRGGSRPPSSSRISDDEGGVIGTQQGTPPHPTPSHGRVRGASSERSVHGPYKATDLLVWWDGQPLSSLLPPPTSTGQGQPQPDPLSPPHLDENFFFAMEQEDPEVRAGMRRRWMEASLRRDGKSLSRSRAQDERASQAQERLIQSLQDKLAHDAEGFGIDRDYIYSQGLRWDLSSCPTEWVQPFLERQQEKDRVVDSILRRGRKAEENDFRAMVEKWAEERGERGGRGMWKKVATHASGKSPPRAWVSAAERRRKDPSEEA